ncbi:MAG: sigma factor, partial [Planctomycetota bacterium]
MHGEAERAFLAFREGGRPRDLARVFDLVAQELLLVAGHLARGGVEAEELVQQTFLTALERRASWDAGRPLVPWLLGILVRLARGERRRLGKERERGGGALETLASEAAGPARLAEDAELAAALAGAIA